MNAIRKYRFLRGMTQAELSEKTGISRASVSFFESEKCHSIAKPTLEKISKALKESPINIMGMENFKIKPSNLKECEGLIELIKEYEEEKGFANV